MIETGEIRHESAQWRQWRTDGDTNLCVHVRGVVALEPDSGTVEFEPDSGGTEIKLGLEDETDVGLVWRCLVRGVDPTPEGDTIISFLADDFEVRTLKFAAAILRNPHTMSARFLTDETDFRPWMRATLKATHFFSPWLLCGWQQLASEPWIRTSVFRDPPKSISVTIRPELFRSRGVFFTSVGELLLGPGGYGGQDLQGFAEVVRQLTYLADDVSINISEPDECLRVANTVLKEPGFFNDVVDIIAGKVELIG